MQNLRFLVLAFLTLQSFWLFGQDSEGNLIYNSGGIRISASLAECTDHHNGTAKAYRFLEMANASEDAITIRFKKNLWYDGKCISCSSTSEEYVVEAKLNPGETISGNCAESNRLRVFVKMIDLKNVRQLTHFELVDIQIEKQ